MKAGRSTIDASVAYDEVVARNYDQDRKEEEHWRLENKFVQDFFELADTSAAAREILDVPVGTGRFLPFYPVHASIVGVDVSENMLRESRSKVSALSEMGKTLDVTLKKGDAFHLQYLDKSFEYVVCFRLLHLIKHADRPALVRELMRVTSSVLLMQVYIDIPRNPGVARKLAARVYRAAQGVWRFVTGSRAAGLAWGHIQDYPLTERELDALLKSSGARQVKRHELCVYSGRKVCVVELHA